MVSRFVPHRIQRRLLGKAVITHNFLPKREELFATDTELGDHSYTSKEYGKLFSGAGFRYTQLCERDWPFQAFVLTPTGYG